MQFPWVFGDCQKSFAEIWREEVVPNNNRIDLATFLDGVSQGSKAL